MPEELEDPGVVVNKERARMMAANPDMAERFLSEAYEKLENDDPTTVERYMGIQGLTMSNLMDWCKANDKEDPREKDNDISKLPFTDRLEMSIRCLQSFQTYADVLSGCGFDEIDDLQGVSDEKLKSFNGIGKKLISALNDRLKKIGIQRNTEGRLFEVNKK